VALNLLQQLVVGITGLNGSLVRPRWQATPPQQPDPTVTWCAIGITGRAALDFPYIYHDSTGNNGDGQDVMQRQERIEVLASIYGPNAQQVAAELRDGLYIRQNTAPIRAYGFALYDVGDMVVTADLVNTQWIPRVDMPIRLMREIDRAYPILNLETLSEIQISTD
jgi:hypothetical protein